MSWKPEVIADSSDTWVGNQVRFATREEAEADVKALAARWTLVTDTRVVESDEPVNYKWDFERGLSVPVEPVFSVEPVEPQSEDDVVIDVSEHDQNWLGTGGKRET